MVKVPQRLTKVTKNQLQVFLEMHSHLSSLADLYLEHHRIILLLEVVFLEVISSLDRQQELQIQVYLEVEAYLVVLLQLEVHYLPPRLVGPSLANKVLYLEEIIRYLIRKMKKIKMMMMRMTIQILAKEIIVLCHIIQMPSLVKVNLLT